MSKPDEEFFVEIAKQIRRKLRMFMPPDAGTPLEFFWPERYCPHCLKEVSIIKASSMFSFSGFYYNEENVLFFYWLCPRCARKIPLLKTEKEQREFSKITEKNLIDAWEEQKPMPC